MAGTTPKYGFPYPLGTDPLADGDNQAKALAERVEAVLGDAALVTAWTALPLAANFIAFGSGFAVPAYRRLGDLVYLRGTVGRTGADAPAGTTCATLPAGFRPPSNLMFVVDQTSAHERLDVLTSGAVAPANRAFPVGGFMSLSGVTFSTTATAAAKPGDPDQDDDPG